MGDKTTTTQLSEALTLFRTGKRGRGGDQPTNEIDWERETTKRVTIQQPTITFFRFVIIEPLLSAWIDLGMALTLFPSSLLDGTRFELKTFWLCSPPNRPDWSPIDFLKYNPLQFIVVGLHMYLLKCNTFMKVSTKVQLCYCIQKLYVATRLC